LLCDLAEVHTRLWISGFRSRPDVDAVLKTMQARFPGVAVQVADLDHVPGSRYARLAALNAIKSFHSQQPIARSLGMEILLYLAGSRQIGEAIERVGVNTNTQRIMAIMTGASEQDLKPAVELFNQLMGSTSEDDLLDNWSRERLRKVQSTFDIGPRELGATLRANETLAEATERLAIERSAMLTVRK